MPTDREYLQCFQMPTGLTITGRASSIRNVFVAAIIPVVQPGAAEIRKVLELLALLPSDLRCAYCGDPNTEWDHLRPLVDCGKPTGYPSSIRNLVPACGKCNQSKGKSDWKQWMTGTAKLSPASRRIPDLQERVERLDAYVRWADCRPLQIQSIVDTVLWTEYYQLQDEILSKMTDAQRLSRRISEQVRSAALRAKGASVS